MWRGLIILGLLGVPTLVFAAPYYEFSPDYSQALIVQPGTTVSQIFAPLNDRLSIIDVWVSTGGAIAGLDIELQNSSGATVATRAVSLGAIADSASGTRRSIILPSQIPVNGGQPYRLNITPTGGAVKIYYSASVSIVPGSGTGGSATYQYGTAIVNGLEQGYSFKFALTESPELTLPIASNTVITQPSIGQAILSLNATEPVDMRVTYGSRAVEWSGQYTTCLPEISLCKILLSVTPGTSYSYSATLKDAWGNVSTAQGSFVAVGTGPTETSSILSSPRPSVPSSSTPATPTPVASNTPIVQVSGPPIIINPRMISLTPSTATFAWTTNEAASSWLVMLVLPELTAWSGNLDNTLELEHYVVMQGLPPDQFLRARITSTDASGESTVVYIDFKTPNGTAPSPSAVPDISSQPTPSPSPSYTVFVSPLGSPTSSPSTSPSVSMSPSAGPVTSPTSTPTPSVVAYPSTSTAPGVITWQPAGGDYKGYRIDIFDEFGNLITTLTVGKGVTSLELPTGVGKGARIIVYADRDGAFEKVGVTTVSDRPSGDAPSYVTSIVIIGGGVTLLAILIGAFVWERRRQKVVASNETSIGLGSGSQAGR